MRPRWRKVLSDLWGNKARSVLVIASIAVGLFAEGMITALHLMLSHDLRAGYASVYPTNIQVSTSLFRDDLVERIQVEVSRYRGRYLVTCESVCDEWLAIDIKAVEISMPCVSTG
jgi:putative ABC transport system permease protein